MRPRRVPRPALLRLTALLAALPLGSAGAQCPPVVLAPAIADFEDEHGAAVAVDGDVLVAGNPRRLAPIFDGDSAVVYRRAAGAWVEEAVLLPPNPVATVDFGQAVAVAGDTILVGDPGGDGAAHFTGAVHVFERTAGQWVETQLLFEAGGSDSDQFGFAVALSADANRAVIGAPHFADAGRVVVFERQGGAFAPAAVIPDPDGLAFTGSGWNFGSSVDVDLDRIAVGNPLSKSSPFQLSGAVFVFELEAGIWKQKVKLSPSSGLRTGASVALSGDVLAAGAPGDSGAFPTVPSANRVFVYRRVGGTWTAEPLLPEPPASGTHLGWSVDVRGDLLVAGEPSQAAQAGRARAYRFDGGAWQELALFDGAAAGDQLGRGVALGSGFAALGAPQAQTGVVPGLGQPFSYSQGPGRVTVSAVPPGTDLSAAPGSLSLAAGGAQALALSTCPPLSGEIYLLLGSLSGTAPGIAVDGLVLPIALDAYTLYLLANPNPPHLPASFGALDAAGTASAALVLPPGSNPAWSGAVFHHAFAVIAAASGSPLVVQVSDAASLSLVP